jgi:hypothetical protein
MKAKCLYCGNEFYDAQCFFNHTVAHQKSGVNIFPEYDEENMRPSAKMPDCPNCNQDELGMLTPEKVFCYFCSSSWLKENGVWIFCGIGKPKLNV